MSQAWDEEEGTATKQTSWLTTQLPTSREAINHLLTQDASLRPVLDESGVDTQYAAMLVSHWQQSCHRAGS